MMKTLLCSCAKCENLYLREWVEHNLAVGFTNILIYDNNDVCGESFDDVIADYIVSGFVRVEDWRGREKIQLKCYQDCLDRFSAEYDWIAFFDCDEFLTLDSSLGDFLSQSRFDGFDIVRVNWEQYDDNGLVFYDGRPLSERFTHPFEVDDSSRLNINWHVKVFVRTASVQSGKNIRWSHCTPHFPRVSDSVRACSPSGLSVEGHSPFGRPDLSGVCLRHYSYKTIEEYAGLKKRRGFPDVKKAHGIRRVRLDTFFGLNDWTSEKQAVAEECLALKTFPMPKDDKRFLVHLHLYYKDQVAYFVEKLKNIQLVSWDLVVTGHLLDEETLAPLRSVCPGLKYMETPDCGYDIYPFIKVLQTYDPSEYDVVMKLHTKGPAKRRFVVSGFPVSGYRWRDEMVDCLLENPGAFRFVSRAFDDPGAGLVCSYPLFKKLTNYMSEDLAAPEELAKYGMKLAASGRFVAGAIFAARGKSLAFIHDAGLEESDFASAGVSHFSGTAAHIYERVISMAQEAQGYRVVTVRRSQAVCLMTDIRRTLQKIFENLFSLRREGPFRTKYLRILFLRIKLHS